MAICEHCGFDAEVANAESAALNDHNDTLQNRVNALMAEKEAIESKLEAAVVAHEEIAALSSKFRRP